MISLTFFTSSCSDGFFDVEDSAYLNEKDIEKLDSISQIEYGKALLQGMYSSMNLYGEVWDSHEDFGYMSIMLKSDLMTDDMGMASSHQFVLDYGLQYWGQDYVKSAQNWLFFYTCIANANSVIESFDLDTQSKEVRAMIGQAYAMRGMALFYIAQTFQQTYVGNEDAPGAPIIITEKEGESRLNRVPLRDMYQQIDKDFETSFVYLKDWSRTNKTYIDESVAAGLYSRVCLVKNDWDGAITYANKARQGKVIYTREQLAADPFNTIESAEWMWGADITSETTTKYASFFSHICAYDTGYGGMAHKIIDAKLYSQMGANDIRKAQFKVSGSGHTYTAQEQTFPEYTNLKFKRADNWLGDYVFMRTSEMILTEAEAYAHKGNGGKAAQVLKELMENRDPDWNKSSVTADEVYQQRRLELWGEGFALFDHLRLKKGIDRNYAGTNHLSGYRKVVPAGSWLFLYQIPIREINNNSEITPADQNPIPAES